MSAADPQPHIVSSGNGQTGGGQAFYGQQLALGGCGGDNQVGATHFTTPDAGDFH